MKKIFYTVDKGRYHKTRDEKAINFLQSLGFAFFDVIPAVVTDEDVVFANNHLEEDYPTLYTKETLQQQVNDSAKAGCDLRNNTQHIGDATTVEDLLSIIKRLNAGIEENQYLNIGETESGDVLITLYYTGE